MILKALKRGGQPVDLQHLLPFLDLSLEQERQDVVLRDRLINRIANGLITLSLDESYFPQMDETTHIFVEVKGRSSEYFYACVVNLV